MATYKNPYELPEEEFIELLVTIVANDYATGDDQYLLDRSTKEWQTHTGLGKLFAEKGVEQDFLFDEEWLLKFMHDMSKVRDAARMHVREDIERRVKDALADFQAGLL